MTFMTGSQFQRYWRKQRESMDRLRKDPESWDRLLGEWRRSMLFHLPMGIGLAEAVKGCTGYARRDGLPFAQYVGWMACLALVVLAAATFVVWNMVRADRRQRGFGWYRGIWPMAMRTYDCFVLAIGIAIGILV